MVASLAKVCFVLVGNFVVASEERRRARRRRLIDDVISHVTHDT